MGAGEMLCVFLVIVQTREDMVLIKRANPSDSSMLKLLRKELMSDNMDYEELNRSTSPPAPDRFRAADSFKQEPIHQHHRHFSLPPVYDEAHEPSFTTTQYPKMHLHRSTTQLQLYPTKTPTEIIHGKNSQGDNPLLLDSKRNENYFQHQQYPLQLQLRNDFVTRFPLIQQIETLQEQLQNQPNQQQEHKFHLLPQQMYQIQQKPKYKLQQQPNYEIQLSYSSDPLMQQQPYNPNQQHRQQLFLLQQQQKEQQQSDLQRQHQQLVLLQQQKKQQEMLLQQQQNQGNIFLNRAKKFWQQNDQQPVNEHQNDQQSYDVQKKQDQQRQQFILLQQEPLLQKQKKQNELLAQQQKFKGQKDLQEIQQLIRVQQRNVQHNATRQINQQQTTPQKVFLGQEKGALQNKQQPNDEQQKYETQSNEQQGEQRQIDQQKYLPQQQKTLQQILLRQHQVTLQNKQQPNDDLPILETESEQDELPKNSHKSFFHQQQRAPLQMPMQLQKELQLNKQLNYEHQEDENQSNEQQSKQQQQAPLQVARSQEQELEEQLPKDQPVNDQKEKSHKSKENLSPRHHDFHRNKDVKYRAYRYIPTTRTTTTTPVKTFQTNSLRPWKSSHAHASHSNKSRGHSSHHQYITRVKVSKHTTARSFKGFKESARADLLKTDSSEDDQSDQRQVDKDEKDEVDLEALLRAAVRRAQARAPPPPLSPSAPADFLNSSAALRRSHDYLRWKYSHGLL